MKVRVYTLKPYWPSDALFIIRPEVGFFDPKHPRTYPGDEVVIIETLTVEQAKERTSDLLGDKVMYTVSRNQIVILERTGRTSADIVQDLYDDLPSDVDIHAHVNPTIYRKY